MARTTREPDIDEGLHPEGPSAADLDRFGDEFRTCAECGHRFYDQSELCPRCGCPVQHHERHMPMWALITIAIVLVVFVVALVF